MKFQIITDKKKKKTYFRIVAANGEILAHAEQYTQKHNAVHAVEIIKRDAADAPIEFIEEDE